LFSLFVSVRSRDVSFNCDGLNWERPLHRVGDLGGASREQMLTSLLHGLEFLVAGDVVRTVALDPNLKNVAVLGFLVLIRTFLSWSLVVEIEGRWPWQASQAQPTTTRYPESGI
jgi:hypothetical protein